jgi:hypothetical protein
LARNDFAIRSSSENRQRMTRVRTYIFRIIDWYSQLGFRDLDIVNDQYRNPFPEELLTELHNNRTELSWGSIEMRNKAFQLVERLQEWRDQMSFEAWDRMDYFCVQVPWEAINGAISEVGEIHARRRPAQRSESLLVASLK